MLNHKKLQCAEALQSNLEPKQAGLGQFIQVTHSLAYSYT